MIEWGEVIEWTHAGEAITWLEETNFYGRQMRAQPPEKDSTAARPGVYIRNDAGGGQFEISVSGNEKRFAIKDSVLMTYC